MPDRTEQEALAAGDRSLQEEVVRLNKIVKSLMDRAERSTNLKGSDFSQFQTTIMLEEQVHRRTEELETALDENERIRRALQESEAKYRGLVSQSLVGITIVEDGEFTYANSKFAEMFGYSMEEARRLGPVAVAIESDRPLVAEEMRQRLSGEVDQVRYVFRGRRKDGVVLDMECHGSVMETGGKQALISLLLDITERTRAEREVQALQDQLREQSIHDPLTGLYNRQPLNEFFNRELILAERGGLFVSAVMSDLDHFKAVNDTYGHLAGDEVLKGFGEMVKQSCRASDITCRYGGEEFLIVLPGMANPVALERMEKLREGIANRPVLFGDAVIHVTASFGVATFPQDGGSCELLIAAADKALYTAKKAGRNRVQGFSESTMDPSALS